MDNEQILYTALNKFRNRLAKKLGYKNVKDKYKTSSPFCLLDCLSKYTEKPKLVMRESVSESGPDGGNIVIRRRFDLWRIDIYLPQKVGFVSLEYEPKTLKFHEAQIFGELGTVYFNHFKNVFEVILAKEIEKNKLNVQK